MLAGATVNAAFLGKNKADKPVLADVGERVLVVFQTTEEIRPGIRLALA